jgi:hypothetical protein
MSMMHVTRASIAPDQPFGSEVTTQSGASNQPIGITTDLANFGQSKATLTLANRVGHLAPSRHIPRKEHSKTFSKRPS